MHRADYRPNHGDGDKQHADASEQEYEGLFRIAGPPPEIHWHMHAAKQRHHPHEAREHAERDGRTASSGRSDDVVSNLPILVPVIRTGCRSGIGRNALRWNGFHARLIILRRTPTVLRLVIRGLRIHGMQRFGRHISSIRHNRHFLGFVVAHGHAFPALPNVLSDAYCTATLPPIVAIVLIRSPAGLTGALSSPVKHGQY